MAQARLETEISGNAAPFIASVEKAEQRAQSFSQRLTGLFRRDPSMRAEHALSGFITDLSSGNVTGAIEGITSRLSGLGLAAGVGVGAVVAIFAKAQAQIAEADKATQSLNKELARPIALGSEGILSQIAAVTAALEASEEKRKGWFVSIREAAQRGQPGITDIGARGEVTHSEPDRVPEAEKSKGRALERLKDSEQIAQRLLGLADRGAPADVQKLAALKAQVEWLAKELKIKKDLQPLDQKALENALGRAQAQLSTTEHSAFKDRAEKAQLSLKDLATEGAQRMGATPEAGPGLLANRALTEEGKSRALALKGDLAGAMEHMDASGRIKNSMSTLRESEKDPVLRFKDALGPTEGYLQQIVKNTAQSPQFQHK